MASGHHGNSVLLIFFLETSHDMWCYFLMNVLAIFMVEEFYIYAVVQFLSAGENEMYESRYQSHWLKVRNLSDAKQYPML